MPLEGERLFLGCIRTHGDGTGFEAGPGAPLPWRMQPARIAIDLSEWEDRPSLEGTTRK